MGGTNMNTEQASQQLAREAMGALTLEEQMALTYVLPNILNGAFWGIVPFERVIDDYKVLQTSKNLRLQKVGSGVLIEANPEFLLRTASKLNRGLVTETDIRDMQVGRAESKMSIAKYMSRLKRGRAKFPGYLGVYCTNDTPRIFYKQNSYPAFRVTIDEIVVLHQEYPFGVRGVDTRNLSADGLRAALWSKAVMSPTHTGIFVPLQI